MNVLWKGNCPKIIFPNYGEQIHAMKAANELKLNANQSKQNRQIAAIVQSPDTRILLTAFYEIRSPH